jgi:RNA-directed DNA polymerase
VALSALSRLSSQDFLKTAWGELNQSNPASKGVDGVSIEQFRQKLESNLEGISLQLKAKSYRFQPLKPVAIPKDRLDPSRGTRELRIPTIRDRVVLKALQLALKDILSAYDAPFSHAYRKKYGVESALSQIESYARVYPYAVEADIKSYFDDVPVDRLYAAMEATIRKTSMLPLIKDALSVESQSSWKEAGADEEDAVFGHNHKGIPQGSAVSPLLANFYLAPFDAAMTARGVRLVRYADDLVMFAKSQDEAVKSFEAAREMLAGMGLGIHPLGGADAKSKIRHLVREGLDCLGYRVEQGKVLPGIKTLRRFRAEVQELTDSSTVGKGYKGAPRGLRDDSIVSRCLSLRNKVEGKAASLRRCDECPQIDELDLYIRQRFLGLFQACGLDLAALSGRSQIKLGLPRFKKIWKSKKAGVKVHRASPEVLDAGAADWASKIGKNIERIALKSLVAPAMN